jgi:iron complex transport system permease protein
MKNKGAVCIGIAIAVIILFFCNLFYGTISIPATAVMDILLGGVPEKSVWATVVLQSRVPQAVTALLSGSALAVSGLMLQTLFRNPLAGPSILGISNGASLGVAVIMLYSGGILGTTAGFSYHITIVMGAFIGASAVLALILYFAAKVKSPVLVLILGIMVGYVASSGISVLNTYASADNIRSYVMWGMGSFSGVQSAQLSFYAVLICLGLFFSILLIKPLNILLLGDNYATNLGANVMQVRVFILLITGFLTAVVTAFCGPVTFIGLAVPHVARMVLGTSNQKLLLPATILSGAALALLCNMMTIIPFGKGLLPLNAVTPALGAPIVIYVILNNKNS